MACGIIFIGVDIFSKSLLTSISEVLVYEDPLNKVEALVVLVGSSSGNRIEAAARLYHEGFAEKLVFSGFKSYPGIATSHFMKSYAIELGVPEGKILTEITDEEVSTRGESISNLNLLHKNKIKTFVLVTSAFHTRRAKMVYERSISLLGYDTKFLVYPAYDPKVPIQGWWELRLGRKGIFFEYIKWIGYYCNL